MIITLSLPILDILWNSKLDYIRSYWYEDYLLDTLDNIMSLLLEIDLK